MGLFIEVQVAAEVSSKPAVVKKLAEVCPVSIFGEREDWGLEIIGRHHGSDYLAAEFVARHWR